MACPSCAQAKENFSAAQIRSRGRLRSKRVAGGMPFVHAVAAALQKSTVATVKRLNISTARIKDIS